MLPSPEDEFEERAISNIKNYGLHIIHVLEQGNLPNFSYSVGLWHSYQHSEVIIIGLKPNLTRWILNELGRRVKEENERFKPNHNYSGFLEGFACNTNPHGF